MAQDLERMAEGLLDRDKAEALNRNAKDIRKLAESPEGKKVGERRGEEKQGGRALGRGDAAELKKLMTKVLSTEEGTRLAQQLMGLMR